MAFSRGPNLCILRRQGRCVATCPDGLHPQRVIVSLRGEARRRIPPSFFASSSSDTHVFLPALIRTPTVSVFPGDRTCDAVALRATASKEEGPDVYPGEAIGAGSFVAPASARGGTGAGRHYRCGQGRVRRR